MDYTEVALCKETLAMWAKLGMDYRRIKCNCVVKLDTRFWEMKKWPLRVTSLQLVYATFR
jgi:hypothetical protein